MRDLALFPLDTVLFPSMPLHLHVFEPRYLLMIHTCLAEQQPFGVALIRSGQEALGELPSPHEFGCTARVTEVNALPDGRLMITALGEERFRILELNREREYLTGKVEHTPLEPPCTLSVMRQCKGLAAMMRRYLAMVSRLHHDEMDLTDLQIPEEPPLLLYLAATMLQIPAMEKQPMLEAHDAEGMMQMLLRVYRREISLLMAGHAVNGPEMPKDYLN
jgi:Lon protease-like protein